MRDERRTGGHDGKPGESEHVLPLGEKTYAQLKKLAQRQLRKRGGDISVQATDLVHQAYERLSRLGGPWRSTSHVLAVACKTMWHILADHARQRRAKKRGGGHHRISVSISDLYEAPRAIDVLVLDDTLQRLEAHDAVQAKLVHLKFFAGLSMAEIAQALGMSKSTAEAEWRHARAWLRKDLAESSG